ncbi:hypothetical protein BGZ93_006710 [Podila epicladia]|nr:hypothetical protein BGZ92_006712 [Podila epicladia]KAG0094838.1 hypothetical protein BGZ93_006710 [Podila epicladia]
MSEFGATVAPNSPSNQVIVVFKPEVSPHQIDVAIKDIEAQGGKITHRYGSALNGFAAKIPNHSLQALTVDVNVDYVEPDGEVTAYARELLSNKK